MQDSLRDISVISQTSEPCPNTPKLVQLQQPLACLFSIMHNVLDIISIIMCFLEIHACVYINLEF